MKKKVIMFVLLVIFIGGIAGGGYYLYKKKNEPPMTVKYGSLEEIDRDIERLERLHKAGGLSWQDTYRLGVAFLQKGVADRSASVLEEAVKMHPDYYKSYESLGMAYYRMNRLDDAISAWEKSIGLNRKAVYLKEMIARAKQKIGVGKRANALEEEVKKGGVDWEKRFELAVLYLSLGRVEDSRVMLKKILKEKKDEPDVYHALAQVYIRTGKIDKAVEFMKKAVKLKPDDEKLKKNLEDLEKMRERYEKIKKHIERGGGK